MRPRKSSMKVSKKKGLKVVKGKKMVATDSRCAVCSEGSVLTKEGKVKKKLPKTCYSMESLIKIAKAYNKTHKGSPIEIKKGMDKEKLWNIIRNKLSGVCSYDEYCWKKLDFIKRLRDNEINHYTFKPEKPDEWKKEPNMWLNTYDILFVMKQYEKIHDDFWFGGVVPSDCPVKITCELSNIDPKKMLGGGIDKMGVVFNLDTSDQDGSHWVGVYASFNQHHAEIDFYDSYGEPATPLIKKFLVQLAGKFDKSGIKPTLIYNDRRHQYGGSECGVFSMNFILERLNGTSMYEISKMDILDKDMNYLRNILYTITDKDKKKMEKKLKMKR